MHITHLLVSIGSAPADRADLAPMTPRGKERRVIFDKIVAVANGLLQRRKIRVHFLHIGKTGGTAVRHALKGYTVTPKYEIHLHPHAIRLSDIPEGEKVVFFLRDPLTRYISGFYSRQRQGRPRYFSPWSEEESLAFNRFDAPDQLARSLSDPDPAVRDQAVQAMRGIQHVRDPFSTWLGDEEYLKSRWKDILFIGFQENLEVDFKVLLRILRLPTGLSLPTESDLAHKNPPELETSLSSMSVRNLESWYALDRQAYALCKAFWERHPS